MFDRTIAAIATPPGDGGVAIIRISGPRAIEIGNQIFSKDVASFESHTLHYGHILDIDTGLLTVMRAPNSYTGEETVEIHCHGGSLISKKVLEAVLDAGAEAAGPGEFTRQAFLNNKLDLAQAEAVQTLIGAKNEQALTAARGQLDGKLSSHIQTFQQELLDTAAILEAWVDFPEEGLEFASIDEVVDTLRATHDKMLRLIDTYTDGRKITDGIHLCLLGCPNAGKSSLMNALLGHDRAIVTATPGTTRDAIDAPLLLGDLHFHLTDTAGIRESSDPIEAEGIRKSRRAMQQADLILLLLDASKLLSDQERDLIALSPADKTLLVWNKVDLPHEVPEGALSVSATTGLGIDALKAAVLKALQPSHKEEVLLTDLRHKRALQLASSDLHAVIDGLQTDTSPELLSADMRSCLQHLSSIIGVDISEEILSSIFAKFCVGK